MKASALVGLMAFGAMPLAAQTMKPNSDGGGAYDGFVRPAISCIAQDHQGVDGEKLCLSGAIDDCRNRSGVYDACLDALADAYDAAFIDVAARLKELGDEGWAETFRQQFSSLGCKDALCRAERNGEALRNLITIAKGIEAKRDVPRYTPQQWRDRMLGEVK